MVNYSASYKIKLKWDLIKEWDASQEEHQQRKYKKGEKVAHWRMIMLLLALTVVVVADIVMTATATATSAAEAIERQNGQSKSHAGDDEILLEWE